MKKRLVLILFCVAALLLSGCADRRPSPLERGIDLIGRMKYLIDSDEVLELYGVDKEEHGAELERLRGVDLSKLQGVYSVRYDSRELLERINGKELSDELLAIYEDSAAVSLNSYINTLDGVKGILLSSCFTVAESFDCKAVEEDMLYYYIYDGAIVGVSFRDGEDDACYAIAAPLICGELDATDAKALEDSLEAIINCDFSIERLY